VRRHLERIVHVAGSPADVFARLDEQTAHHPIDEVRTAWVYPSRKAWKTRGAKACAVIDAYSMGYEIAAEDGGSRLKVWIDYAPSRRPLTELAARVYARWRVDDLAQDAADSFTDMTAAVAAHP